MEKARIGILMGSLSDWEVMSYACRKLDELGVPYEKRVVSAHRTPQLVHSYASAAQERGVQVIIAGAGGSAHLPGMLAAQTTLPVLGVPITGTSLQGLDALLSIVQMPKGIPVGTLAIGKAGAINAALLAVQILALQDGELARKLKNLRELQTKLTMETIFPKED